MFDTVSSNVVKYLIHEHGNNSSIAVDKITHVSGVIVIDDENANSACVVHLDNSSTFNAIYNRLDISSLFGFIDCKLRRSKVNWSDSSQVVIDPISAQAMIIAEIKELYGINLFESVTFRIGDGGEYYLDVNNGNPAYYGTVSVTFYDKRYSDAPINLMSSYTVKKWKGEYTLIPMQPYPPGAFLLTSNKDYDPNGDILGTWVQETPVVVDGAEAELWNQPIAATFEFMGNPGTFDNVTLIDLSDTTDAVDYNVGKATLTAGYWFITDPKSPIKGESIKVRGRKDSPLDIRVYMITSKVTGHKTGVDNPEYKWHRDY